MTEEYTLINIPSHRNISHILNVMCSLSDKENQIVALIKDFYRDPETKIYYENGIKIALVGSELLKNMKNKQLNFSIYTYSKDQFPNLEKCVPHFFFPPEKNNSSMLREKMELFTNFGIIPENSWHINTKKGICEFDENIPLKTRLKIKIILDSPFTFRVSWCRKNVFFKHKTKACSH